MSNIARATHPAPATWPVANSSLSWSARLQQVLNDKGTSAVLGLDPNPQYLPETFRPDRSHPEQTTAHLLGWFDTVMEQTADLFGVVKLQAAWFELHGSAGIRALEEMARRLRDAGILVICDVKRGDIGVSAQAYAQAWIGGEQPLADAMTLLPWLGPESLQPYRKVAEESGTGAFVCARTSNPDSDTVQEAQASTGYYRNRPLWHLVADMVHKCAPDDGGKYLDFGLVVGANHPATARQLREQYPRLWMLAPGLGAQGADFANAAAFIDDSGGGALFPSSRAITFPATGGIRDAAKRFIDRLQRATARR